MFVRLPGLFCEYFLEYQVNKPNYGNNRIPDYINQYIFFTPISSINS